MILFFKFMLVLAVVCQIALTVTSLWQAHPAHRPTHCGTGDAAVSCHCCSRTVSQHSGSWSKEHTAFEQRPTLNPTQAVCTSQSNQKKKAHECALSCCSKQNLYTVESKHATAVHYTV